MTVDVAAAATAAAVLEDAFHSYMRASFDWPLGTPNRNRMLQAARECAQVAGALRRATSEAAG